MITPEDLAKAFHAALVSRDWPAMRALFHDDASWTLPGDNAISGTAMGADAVVERAKLIASYGLSFKLENILLSRHNMALALHNTAERDGVRLDEKLATVCRLREGRIAEIETFLSDVPGMNRFFGVH
ncbi:ketosteroid isomerase-like protein [Bosea sp. BE271]|uniref:nuclear transport factor 2 family protein n=1 Tax=Bosea TaxID=85413 RepID=UPI002863AB6A|nr:MULTISPECIES: nuclear transport factor 2 family protein [Bosea]MDR6827680.1 ketosteroid isomerase-like protein [Bosea robiniae]MDR6894626.1 ketosteroid isomerase-like protein [Bosea sp. BE109]MDR7137786.1 ketosteroid isomerase-like protein [Bosea sp. BE168]MDR7174485.1 ketosteroid isomerase-like protein [Bosea sp. BE271]